MSHSGFLLTELDRILKHLSDQPQNFQVTHPDSTHAQWLPENAASAFYKKTYGISDLTQLLDFEAPPQPKGIHLCRDEILIASESILNHSLYNTHDGDFAEPPAFVAVGERRISLADAFQALAHSLCDWKKTGALPSDLILPFIHGPLDYPAYQQKVVPVLPNIQFIGYTPTELDRQDVPDANIINNQGLPAAGDLYLWLPTHTLAEGTAVIDAVAELDMSFAVPGVIHLQIPSEESRQDDESKSIEISVNAAEFLYAMAQVFRQLVRNNKPGPVALVSMKITENQRTECVLVKPGGPRDSFIWRSESDPNELDAAWNRVPAVGEEQILWASLPPLGDKVKRKLGRMVGDWQLKKR